MDIILDRHLMRQVISYGKLYLLILIELNFNTVVVTITIII